MKWYNSFWVVVFFCVFVSPVGTVLLWLHPKWSQKAKIIWTLIVGFTTLWASSRIPG